MTIDSNANISAHVLSVPDAGRVYLNLGRNASYEAAHRGEIPTIRIGRKILVPIIALERMLNDVGNALVKNTA